LTAADNLSPRFDLHVTECHGFGFENIESGPDLDDVDDIFDLPFVKVVKDMKVSDDVVGNAAL